MLRLNLTEVLVIFVVVLCIYLLRMAFIGF